MKDKASSPNCQRARSAQSLASFFHNKIVAMLSLALLSSAVHAGTAVCKDAVGRTYGQHSSERGIERIDGDDGMAGVIFVVTWGKAAKPTVITSDSRLNLNLTREALLIRVQPDQVDIVTTSHVDDEWLFSIFPKSKVALITTHGTGASAARNGAVATTLLAQCTITE